MNTAITGSSTPGQRTFDCPWCGAINPVPSDHLGEHFPCPECKRTTKLTEKNTSAGRPTEAPPDAPHLSGDRTFDCPWCGAISAVPSSHLGERFACPECKRDTRLTSTNTRRSPITAPPPDAPPPVPAASRAGLWVLAGLVVAGGIAWAVATGGGGGGSQGEPESASTGAPPAGATGERPSESRPPPMGAEATPTTAPRVPAEPATPPTAPAAAPGKDAELAAAKGALAKAAADLADAERALADARSKFDAWTKDNSDVAEKEGWHAALQEIGGEMKRLVAATPALLDPAKTTPQAAHAFDSALVAFVGASPARVSVVQQALMRMRQEIVGRRLRDDWKAVEFHGPAFARAFAALDEAYGGMAGLRPPELSKAVSGAESAVVAARQAEAGAESRIAEIQRASK